MEFKEFFEGNRSIAKSQVKTYRNMFAVSIFLLIINILIALLSYRHSDFCTGFFNMFAAGYVTSTAISVWLYFKSAKNFLEKTLPAWERAHFEMLEIKPEN